MSRLLRRSVLFIVLGLSAGVCAPVHAQSAARPAQAVAENRWASDMEAFARADRDAPPTPGGVVFVGSSSIRLWNLSDSFPGTAVVNRGFGGSQIADAVRHVDLLVLKHAPATVVFYAGDNDLAAGKSPAQVLADYTSFVSKVHAALPRTRIAFVGIKPSIARWKMVEAVREANTLIRAMCDKDDRLGFIDVDGPMLGYDGRPRADLFVADGLHLSPKGYELWTILTRPFVE